MLTEAVITQVILRAKNEEDLSSLESSLPTQEGLMNVIASKEVFVLSGSVV